MNGSEDHQLLEYMLPDMDSTFRLFAAHVRTVTKGWSYPRHRHPLFEVNVVLEGIQEMTVGGKRYEQRAGDVILLPPEMLHGSRIVGSEQMTYYCLHFNVDDRVLREMLCKGEDCLYPGDGRVSALLRPSLERLISLTSSDVPGRPADKMRTMSAVFELFAGLIEGLTMPDHTEETTGSRNRKIAYEIAAELERRVEDPESWGTGEGEPDGEDDGQAKDTLAAITSRFGYSASSCARMFRSIYGMSPRQYLSALKLKKAKLLLMEPELSVESVSLRLGYKDIAHFSRQFKRWTGESPGKFRSRFHL